MSAFIVEDETINKIVAGVNHALHYGDGFSYPSLHRDFLSSFGMFNLDKGNRQLFGEVLFSLNIDGVNERYGEGEAEKFRPLNYQYKSMVPPNVLQFYQSLRCLIYQCSEGDVVNNPLYKKLDELLDDIAHTIAQKQCEKHNVQWG